jgi:hypothetical protein
VPGVAVLESVVVLEGQTVAVPAIAGGGVLTTTADVLDGNIVPQELATRQ